MEIEVEGIRQVTPAELRRVTIAVGIGNFMEWFDWGLYGFFAVVIGKQVFPNNAPGSQLLSTLAIFAVGFVLRPLGGVVLGPLADKLGRRAALSISLLLMGISTAALGLLPNYAAIGIWSPILLLLIRCVQGFSTGGEVTGANSFLVESAPESRRGLVGSIASVSSAVALMTASLTALLLTTNLSAESFNNWGWRAPFLFAAPLALVGLYLRLRLEDTPVFSQMKRENRIDRSSFWSKVRKDYRPILLTFAVGSVQGVGYYYLAAFAVNFLTVAVGLPRPVALTLSTITLAIYACMCVLAGVLIDRYGRRSINIIGTIGFIVVLVPAFMLIATGNFALIILGLSLVAFFQSLVSVSTVVLMVELFPAGSRATGCSTGFNLANVIVGGPGPYVATWLGVVTGSPIAPAGYLIVVSLIALPILLRWLPETKGRDLSLDELIESPLATGRRPNAVSRMA
jgi:MHS family proline/betaine transporter-like MFS transporter